MATITNQGRGVRGRWYGGQSFGMLWGVFRGGSL